MTTKYTKGPWSLADSPETADGTRTPDGTWIDINARGLHAGLARVVWRMEDDNRSPEKEANAYLIAAAPELLEALKAAVDCGMVPVSSASDGGANKYSEQVRVADQIRAAIAKATGEQE